MIANELVNGALEPLQLSEGELPSLVAALSRPPRPAIRTRVKISPEPLRFPTSAVGWHPQGRFIDGDVRPGGRLEFAAGDYYIQDASSLLALTLLDAKPGEWICDLCASPGGKSTAVLQSLDDQGWLLCNEAIHSRVGPLELNLARNGHVRYVLSQLDPDDLARRLGPTFDAVLVDAPCSGQSLVSRGKQSESAFLPQTIRHCAARQARIMQSAADLVRPGGRLVYSTCTFAFAENEGLLAAFLAHNKNWRLDPCDFLTPWLSPYGEGYYRLWPHRDACGGAFAARLVRDHSDAPPRRNDCDRYDLAFRPTARPGEFHDWGELTASEAYRVGARCFAWPPDVDTKLLKVGVAGPEICFRKGTTWFPSYALAMRRDKHWQARQEVQLNDDQAAQFVQGQSVAGDTRGWAVACWQGRPLGWLKGDGTRLKNHLPKSGRITLG